MLEENEKIRLVSAEAEGERILYKFQAMVSYWIYLEIRKGNIKTPPLVINLDSILSWDGYNEIINSLLVMHNLGNSSEQLIDILKNKIVSQQLASDRIDKYLRLTTVQYEHIKKANN